MELPVIVPVFSTGNDEEFTLESFVSASVCVQNLKEDLTSNNSRIIGYMSEWVKWGMTDNVPVCITVDELTNKTKAYIGGVKVFLSLKQCMAKLRLSKVTANGDVVNVERSIFIRSYSFVMSYSLDIRERKYKFEACTPLPSYMTAVKEYVPDKYNLLNSMQALREKQLEACVNTLLLITVEHKEHDSISTYKILKQQTHFTKLCK